MLNKNVHKQCGKKQCTYHGQPKKSKNVLDSKYCIAIFRDHDIRVKIIIIKAFPF